MFLVILWALIRPYTGTDVLNTSIHLFSEKVGPLNKVLNSQFKGCYIKIFLKKKICLMQAFAEGQTQGPLLGYK